MFTFVRSGQRFAPQCHISFIFLVIFVSYFVYIYAKTSFTGLSTQTIFTIDVQEKWKAYLQRIRTHVSPPDVMLAAHHPGDEMCPWVHAEIILSAFNTRRQELGSTVVEVEWLTGMQKSKKNKSLHNYHDKVIYRPRYLQRLLPTCIGVTERMAVGSEDWLFEPAPRLDSCCRKEAGHAGLQEIMRSSIVDGLAKVTADQLRRSSSGSPWSTLDKPSRPPFREPPVESRAKRAKAEGSCRSMEQQQHLSEQPRTPDSSPDGLDCPHALPDSASSKALLEHSFQEISGRGCIIKITDRKGNGFISYDPTSQHIACYWIRRHVRHFVSALQQDIPNGRAVEIRRSYQLLLRLC
jgi:hypothetical protein